MCDDPQDRDTQSHPAPFLAQNQHTKNNKRTLYMLIVKHLSFRIIYKIKK
jgi:hypothetical protein